MKQFTYVRWLALPFRCNLVKNVSQIARFQIRDVYSVRCFDFRIQGLVTVFSVEIPQSGFIGYESPIQTEDALNEIISQFRVSRYTIR